MSIVQTSFRSDAVWIQTEHTDEYSTWTNSMSLITKLLFSSHSIRLLNTTSFDEEVQCPKQCGKKAVSPPQIYSCIDPPHTSQCTVTCPPQKRLFCGEPGVWTSHLKHDSLCLFLWACPTNSLTISSVVLAQYTRVPDRPRYCDTTKQPLAIRSNNKPKIENLQYGRLRQCDDRADKWTPSRATNRTAVYGSTEKMAAWHVQRVVGCSSSCIQTAIQLSRHLQVAGENEPIGSRDEPQGRWAANESGRSKYRHSRGRGRRADGQRTTTIGDA